jgi:hypothetical protein
MDFYDERRAKLTQVLQNWKKEAGGLQVIMLTDRYYNNHR